MESLEFDTFLVRYVGAFNRRQSCFFFLLALEMTLGAMYILSPVFLLGTADHWCTLPEIVETDCTLEQNKNIFIPKNEAGVYASCIQYNFTERNNTHIGYSNAHCDQFVSVNETVVMGCETFEYSTRHYEQTMVSEWDLVCDRAVLTSTVNAVFMAGLIVGCLILGPMADTYGRKVIIVGTASGNFVIGLAMAFVPNYQWVLACRFIAGFLQISRTATTFLEALELVGPKWRASTGWIYGLFWALGYVLLPGIAYVFRQWRHLQIALILPELLLVVVYIFFLPESPRWLFVNNRTEEGMKVLRYLAGDKSKTFPDDVTVKVTDEKHKPSVLDIVTQPGLRFVSIAMGFMWAACSMVYYGLALNTSNLGGDPYINCFISGAVEIPAYLSLGFVLSRVGRVPTVGGYMVFGSVALFAVAAVPTDMNWLIITFAMTGKFCMSAAFMLLWVFTPELYPTTHRSLGMNVCSACARASALLATFVYMLSDVFREFPLLIFAVVAIMAGAVTFTLPETKNKPLPQNLEESEKLIETASWRRFCKREHHEAVLMTEKV